MKFIFILLTLTHMLMGCMSSLGWPQKSIELDASIEKSINYQLFSKFPRVARIEVITFNQKVVILGVAKDEATKTAIGNFVKSIPNVRSSFNEVFISENINEFIFTGPYSAHVQSKILSGVSSSGISQARVKIRVLGGSVYMMGVLTQSEANAVKKIASNLDGVKDVYVYFDIIANQ